MQRHKLVRMLGKGIALLLDTAVNALSNWCGFSFRWGLKSITLVLLCIGLISCSTPIQVGGQPTDAQLKAKVLQIIRENPQVILDSVQAYNQTLQDQQQQAQKSFLQGMKTDPQSVIGESPTTGSAEKKVVLMMFSDFQCPYCAVAHQTLKQFMASHQNQVTLVYKHLPLTGIHAEAMSSAKAAWAAGQQAKFWEFHDALFTQQDKLGEPLYIDTAKALNLDLKRFDEDRKNKSAEVAIQKDMEMAKKLGVDGTPFMVMNGVPFSGAAELPDLEAALKRVSNS